MKTICIAVLFYSVALLAQESNKPHIALETTDNLFPGDSSARGGGVAPSNWGFITHYYGSAYGTGYYPFHINRTNHGVNAIAGISFTYPHLTSDLRAVYTFDISSLAGLPGPIWTGFIFDIRERPNPETMAIQGWQDVNLITDRDTHTIVGLQFNSLNNAAHLDIYDAKELENAEPFAHPELAFSGNNPLLGTVLVLEDAVTEVSFDVTEAVNADLPAPIPTLSEYGMMACLTLMAVAGVIFMRRNRATRKI